MLKTRFEYCLIFGLGLSFVSPGITDREVQKLTFIRTYRCPEHWVGEITFFPPLTLNVVSEMRVRFKPYVDLSNIDFDELEFDLGLGAYAVEYTTPGSIKEVEDGIYEVTYKIMPPEIGTQCIHVRGDLRGDVRGGRFLDLEFCFTFDESGKCIHLDEHWKTTEYYLPHPSITEDGVTFRLPYSKCAKCKIRIFPPPQLDSLSTVCLWIESYVDAPYGVSISMSIPPALECLDTEKMPKWKNAVRKGDIYEGCFKIKPTAIGPYRFTIRIMAFETPEPPDLSNLRNWNWCDAFHVEFGIDSSGRISFNLSPEDTSVASRAGLTTYKSHIYLPGRKGYLW